ncbi:MAG TPA: AAA family ATPase, partial [Schlesneria sp.]
ARIVDTAGNDVAVAAARADAIRGNMATATSATAAQNQARVKLAQLQAEATSDHALYQSYLDRLKQTQQQASLRVPDVHLASAALPPLAPVSPKKTLIIGGATIASLVLGFLLALAGDRMCSGFRAPRDLENILGLSVLAVIPELNVRPKSFKDVAMRVLARTHNEFSEAIRGLEIGLSLHLDDAGDRGRRCGKAILVTSALPAEGKTAISVSLARRLAISGHKVVVIDADYRRPKVAVALGLRSVKYDLADYLARRCSLEEALCPDPYSPLVVLPAVHTAEGGEMISSSAMAALITRLRGVADFVVIDSPPVLAVNDTRLLAGMADTTIFVVRWGKTPREAAALAVRLLRDFRVNLVGAVLARANARQQQYYTFGYTGAPALADYSKNLAA